MNAKTETGIVNIRGKDYQTVAYRVKMLRDTHPLWSIITDVVHRDELCVVMRASIVEESGRTISTGYAEEYRKTSAINKTSALENCETSAIGRALAAAGLGGTEFASADEVAHAINGKQSAPDPDAFPDWKAALEACDSMDALHEAWKSMPADARAALASAKDAAKTRLAA